MDKDAPLSIREVAERSGCSPSALRYYEAEGLISPLPRRATAQRCYPPQVLDTLAIISALRDVGFGIGEIRRLLSIKQPEDAAGLRLEKAALALEDLAATLRERRLSLERAEALLSRWQTEVAQAQAETLPKKL